jgi:hypothetical protein
MASQLKTALGMTVIILAGVVWYSILVEYSTDPSSKERLWSYHRSQRTAMNERMDDWKSYINNKYGFSIKYPKNWSVQEDSAELIGFCPSRGGLSCRQREGVFSANVQLEIHENPKELKVREYLFVERYGQLPEKLAELAIDGYPAIRLGPEGTSKATLYIAKHKYIYKLQSQDSTNIFGKMIKTLKFND